MTEAQAQIKRQFPAIVAEVIDAYSIAINRGTLDGIKVDQQFLIYSLSAKEIIDPETHASLGFLEIVKGRGKIVHVQEQLAILKSVTAAGPFRKIIKRKPASLLDLVSQGEQQEEVVESGELLPFDDPKVGDKAKPI